MKRRLTETFRTGSSALLAFLLLSAPTSGADQIRKHAFEGVLPEHKITLRFGLGAHWFTWRDEPMLGRNDCENYKIGFVDATDRPFPELVEAAKTTHRRLHDVHAAKTLPFVEKPKASDFGTPSSPWDL